MALRMRERGVAGCVVGGRVRDLAELKKSGLSVSCSVLCPFQIHCSVPGREALGGSAKDTRKLSNVAFRAPNIFL